ncbi:hypothetical protein BDQ17DRAFT_1330955 [Cyathus striatus]|nr:hypothetical protein BDQ17DRAFT_1330955 [Cyathus striatus]
MISGDIYMKYATSKDEVNLSDTRQLRLTSYKSTTAMLFICTRIRNRHGRKPIISYNFRRITNLSPTECATSMFPQSHVELQELIDKCCPLPPCWPSPMTSVDALVLKYREETKIIHYMKVILQEMMNKYGRARLTVYIVQAHNPDTRCVCKEECQETLFKDVGVASEYAVYCVPLSSDRTWVVVPPPGTSRTFLIIRGDIYMKCQQTVSTTSRRQSDVLTENFTSTNKPRGFPLNSLNSINRLLLARLQGVSGSLETNPSSIPPQEHIVIQPLLGLSSKRNILMWCIIAGDSICLQELETAGCVIKPIISYGFRRIMNLSPTEMRNKYKYLGNQFLLSV